MEKWKGNSLVEYLSSLFPSLLPSFLSLSVSQTCEYCMYVSELRMPSAAAADVIERTGPKRRQNKKKNSKAVMHG